MSAFYGGVLELLERLHEGGLGAPAIFRPRLVGHFEGNEIEPALAVGADGVLGNSFTVATRGRAGRFHHSRGVRPVHLDERILDFTPPIAMRLRIDLDAETPVAVLERHPDLARLGPDGNLAKSAFFGAFRVGH